MPHDRPKTLLLLLTRGSPPLAGGALLSSALLGTLLGCTLLGCTEDAQPTLTLTGSSTVAPLAMEIGRRFETERAGVRVDVQMGGSSRGIGDARRGLADIGMVSRALDPDETGLVAHTIAHDGICLIVQEGNAVAGLSDPQVRAIFTGEVERWSEVGGADAPITVVNKAEGRATLALFLEHFELRATDIEADVVIGDNEQGIRTVAGNPGAVGYVSIGTAEYDAAHGVAIRLVPVGGVAPSTASLRSGEFPLSRPLNLVTLGPAEGLAREFIEFARSPAAADLVEQQFFVPVEP